MAKKIKLTDTQPVMQVCAPKNTDAASILRRCNNDNPKKYGEKWTCVAAAETCPHDTKKAHYVIK